MNILINASNLKLGGGLQVADSVCRELYKYPQHHFTVVYNNALAECAKEIQAYNNVRTVEYETPVDIKTTLTCRDKTLDNIVESTNIEAVLTIFGPSRWCPKVPHLSGFAQGHIVQMDSPYWGILSTKQKLRIKWRLKLVKWSLDKSADNYYTENPLITQRLQKMFPKKQVFTVTNNANQIFKHPQQWDKSITLPPFEGITFLTVAAGYPHKNLRIIIPTCRYLEERHPEFKFRFVLTVNEEKLTGIDACARRHILFLGPVKIQQVPYLYEQSNVMFLPTLLECFSASYAEAMVMKIPVLTTDLDFARGLCGDAAMYFKAISPEALGEAVVRLCADQNLRDELVKNGIEQLKKFDTSEERAQKLIELVEQL